MANQPEVSGTQVRKDIDGNVVISITLRYMREGKPSRYDIKNFHFAPHQILMLQYQLASVI